MIICDTHCDTISELLNNNADLYKNSLHIDIEKMKSFSGFAQFFAAFIDPEFYANPKKRFLQIAMKFIEEVQKNEIFIMQCKGYEDYLIAKENCKIAAFLTIEGGECICTLDDLDEYYNLGVRVIALTWNNKNHIATGVLSNENTGLSEFGKQVVEKMNKKRMIVDVSHLNEESFFDVVGVTKNPLFATHSNLKSICPHKRNLTDEQFEIIRQSGGFVGINIYPEFINQKQSCTISDIFKHIDRFLELGGEDTIGFGCDFDGIDRLPEDINNVADIQNIVNEMYKYGYSNEIIDKIAHKNFEKAIKFF